MCHINASLTADIEFTGMLWQGFRCLPSASLGFSRQVLLSIAKNEAKLKVLISGEHGMTRSAMLKELRDIQLALNEALQIAVHNLPTDESSPWVTGSEISLDGVSQESSLGKKLSPEMLETSLPGSDETDRTRGPLTSAVETLKGLERVIRMHSQVLFNSHISQFEADICRK